MSDRADRWQDFAACTGRVDIAWIPPAQLSTRGPHQAARIANLERAKAVCNECPVKATCLAEALRDGLVGIWGGSDDKERDAMPKPRRLKPIDHGTRNGYVMHTRRGEDACPDCFEANAVYFSQWRRARESTSTRLQGQGATRELDALAGLSHDEMDVLAAMEMTS